MTEEIKWSDWLDFSEEQVSIVPETPGIYMMHAAMKILFIGGSSNLRQSIRDSLKTPCTSEAKRFRYYATSAHAEMAKKILGEYQEKHDGNLPKCME